MYPLRADMRIIFEQRDKEIKSIISGETDKLLLIIGPCSADHEDSVIDYISRLRTVQEKVADKIFIIPRIYTNKPRTTGDGYKGMVHQPDPSKAENMLDGIVAVRRLHTRVIEESGLTSADEMLYPENYRFLSDVLVERAPEVVGYVVLPVGEGSGPAEAAHDRAALAVHAPLDALAVDGTAPAGQFHAHLEHAHMQVRGGLGELVGAEDAARSRPDDDHVEVHDSPFPTALACGFYAHMQYHGVIPPPHSSGNRTGEGIGVEGWACRM